MANVLVAFLIVRDGANNAASCEGLHMASRERSRKEATQPLDRSAVSWTGAIERVEYMLGTHPLFNSSLLWPQNHWNIVLLQCRVYLCSFLCMKYIPTLINMYFMVDKLHFGPFVRVYPFCVVPYTITKVRMRCICNIMLYVVQT